MIHPTIISKYAMKTFKYRYIPQQYPVISHNHHHNDTLITLVKPIKLLHAIILRISNSHSLSLHMHHDEKYKKTFIMQT